MISDMHVHTKYSVDSVAEMDEHCQVAVERGIKNLCFTDHVDNNPNDSGYGYYDQESYFNDFFAIKDKYSDKINLLSGMEFSEPQSHQDKLRIHMKLPYDMVMGSTHLFYNDQFLSQMVARGISVEDCYKNYWPEILASVSHGGFDVLGHIDFPKRYYKELVFEEDMIGEICETMIQNGICLEINTSSLRRGINTAMPDAEILSIYKKCGGKYVTIGSDAHMASDLGAGYEYAKALAESFGLTEVIFVRRERIIVR